MTRTEAESKQSETLWPSWAGVLSDDERQALATGLLPVFRDVVERKNLANSMYRLEVRE